MSQQSVSVTEICQLTQKQVDPKEIKFANITFNNINYVVVRGEGSVAVIELSSKASPTRLPVGVDSAIMNPSSKVLAMRMGPNLTLYSLEMKAKMKQSVLNGTIVFWKWIDSKTVGIVTTDAVYHWSLEGSGEPERIFERSSYDAPVQIINYQSSADGKWLMLNGLSVDAEKNFNGVLQVYSVDARASQPTLNAPAACFSNVQLENRDSKSNLFCFALKDASGAYNLKIIEVGVPKDVAFNKQAAMRFADKDFPMGMVADAKLGILYVTSQAGYLFAYEIQSGKPVYANKAASCTMFASTQHPDAGVVTIDLTGRVARFQLDKANVVNYVCNTLNDMELGIAMARRYDLPGADHMFKSQFAKLLTEGRTQEALELAASSPQGVLRNTETMNRLKQAGPQVLLTYFQHILSKPNGKLNKTESVELARPLLAKGPAGVEHIKNWIKENKLEASEDLGELLRQGNPQLALSVFLRAEAKEKVVSCFVQLGAGETDDAKAGEFFINVFRYAKKVEFTPNYGQLLQQSVRFNADRAKDFALLLVNSEEGPKMEVNAVTDQFLAMRDVKNATNIMLEYLRTRGDREEDAALQTKLLEANLMHAPHVANAIMDSEEYRFSHYDKVKIAQLCETAQLYQRALEHYTEPSDIKRVLSNAPAIKPEFLLDYFGTLPSGLGMECLRDLLKQSLQQNIRLVVEVAKKWIEHFGADELIALFEDFKSFNGLYFFLGSFVNFTTNPSVVFKYIEAAVKIGPNAAKEIERVCRENNHYDPKEVKDYLMEQPTTLKDPRALIHVCERFDFLEELTTFLFNNNLVQFIEAFVQRKSPAAAPAVVGSLLDLNAPEEQIRKLIEGLRAPSDDPEWVSKLTDAVEKRNRLRLLRTWLEARMAENSTDSHVYTSLAKLYVDSNSNAKYFLETNDKYDPIAVGAFCESRDPTLAVIVYRKGNCDAELIAVTSKNGFFKEQARYLVQRMDLDAWATVLTPENPHRRALIDQVVSTALPESHNPEEVSSTVKAFMAADLPTELIELLDRLMLHSGTDNHFHDNGKLQNLLILTAVKADQKRVMEYLRRLEHYDADKIASVCLLEQHALYEEAFYIFKKAKKHTEAVEVLIHHIQDLDRAVEFAQALDRPDVWAMVGKAQLDAGLLSEAVKSLLKAEDATHFKAMIAAVQARVTDDDLSLYDDLILYLQMVRGKARDAVIDAELLFALAKTGRLADLEDFVPVTNTKLVDAGDRLFAHGLYTAARIVYTHIANYAKLAMTLVKLELWQEAVDAARKAKAIATWKFVCFACADAEQFKLAQVCGLNVVAINEHLQDLVQHFEQRGYFSELISLLEAAINLERTHQGIFTSLGVCYAKYREDKVMEHIKLFHSRANIAQLITACRQHLLWAEAVFLSQQYEQYENAVDMMMDHSAVAWKHELFKEILSKCANSEIVYRAVDFYLAEHPLLLNDVLLEAEKKVDASRVVHKLRQAGHLPLVRKFLLHVQHHDVAAVNEAVNELCIAEEDHKALRASISDHTQFDVYALAQQLEKHDLLEFRRVAVLLYQKHERWDKALELAKKDELWQDAMDTAAAAKQPTLTQSLLRFFVDQGLDQCFSAMLFACHDSIAPDVVLELAWKHNLTNFAMPYMIQTFQQYHQRMAAVEKKLEEQVKEKKEDKAKDAEIQQGAQDAIGLGLVPGNNVPMIPMLTMAPGMGQGMGQGMGGNMGMGMGGNMGMGMGMGNGNQGW